MLELTLESSTPDGLAPISLFALSILILSVSAIAIFWGVFNFLQLFRIGPQNDEQGLIAQTSPTHIVRQMAMKIIVGSLHYMKFNFAIILVAAMIFFLVILGAIEKFQEFSLSVSYLLGVGAGLLCSLFIVFTSSFSYFRVVYSSRYSGQGAFIATKNATNSITFICTGLTLAGIMGVMLKADPQDKTSQDQINKRADMLLQFAFGYITVAMCTKITSLIYSKGADNSFEVAHLFNHNLPKDHRHPMVICKGIGQTANKSLSKALDYLMMMTAVVAIVTKAAGMNVVGVDQKGQIIFQLSSDNSFAAILLMGFGLFFSTLISLYRRAAQTEGQVKMHFRIHIIGISVLLFGFTSLACYLALPAEYQIVTFVEQGDVSVRSPVLAYLCVITGMAISLLISLSAQITSSALYYIYSLLQSCKTGAATCLIFGLSMGYLYTIVPILVIAPFGFLCYYWLGVYGVSLGLVGVAIFIPYYMNASLYHSIMNTSSMICYVSKANESSVGSLLALNQSKKVFQSKLVVYFNQITCLFGYVAIAVFSQQAKLYFSIAQPQLFSGLLVGAMFPYLLSAITLNSAFKVSPVLCYDTQEQVQQNPGISKGNVQFDFHRSNRLFTLNSSLQIWKFLPLLIIPNFVFGMALSIQCLLGFMGGLALSSVQMSISNGMSGTLWGNVKDQISLGKAKDQESNDIAVDSQWGKAAQVGNNVGSNLKDSSGQSVYAFFFWTLTMASAFEGLYIRIHSE